MSPREPFTRRHFLGSAAASGALVALTTTTLPGTAAAAPDAEAATDAETAAAPAGASVPLPQLRVPQVDLGVQQQSDSTIGWLADAKVGMFIHWGIYAGPAKEEGEWYLRAANSRAGIPPSVYRQKHLIDPGPEQFTADQFNPTAWADLAKAMGAKYVVLTTRHHDGFSLFPNPHPNAWTSAQEPLKRDFIADYVAAVRAAGLKVGMYYSPLSWQYPGYYNVNGEPLSSPPWNYEGSDPDSFDYVANARVMKEEVYEGVKQLVTNYGPIDDIWWDGAWLAESGEDRDSTYFWEPGQFRDPDNRWPVGDHGENDTETGRPLGLMGMVRRHQPDVVVTPRSGWVGDYATEEGSGVPDGPIRAGVVEKEFTLHHQWGYVEGDSFMSYDGVLEIVVNSIVRNMTTLINVGPDRHGTVPQGAVEVLTRLGEFLSRAGESIYNTRGGPWQPVDGKVGYTYRDNTFYAHLLPGQPYGTFTTPPIGDAKVRRVYAVPDTGALSHTVNADATVTIDGIDRTTHPQDTVIAIELDRPVVAPNIARGKPTTADSEDTAAGNIAAHATDGDTATYWSADNGDAGHWLQVDLGGATNVTGVRIAWELTGRVYRYRIESSGDGNTWSTMADLTGNTDPSQIHTVPLTGTARYLRITVTGLDADHRASIREFEIFDRPFS